MIGTWGRGQARAGWGRTRACRGELPHSGKFAETKLREVAHMRKSMLQLSQFTVNPALPSAVLGQMGLKECYRKHFRAALFTHCTAQVSFFDGDNF